MPVSNYDSIKRGIVILAVLGMLAALNLSAEVIDYHQHLYSPDAGARSSPGPKGIDADYLVAQLDAAGISRAVVLSVAYSFSNPNTPPVPNEYAHVMDENNWTSAQVAKYPHRLLGFCSVNPLRPYALEEIARCAKDPNLRSGLKLHFGNSDVNVTILIISRGCDRSSVPPTKITWQSWCTCTPTWITIGHTEQRRPSSFSNNYCLRLGGHPKPANEGHLKTGQ